MQYKRNTKILLENIWSTKRVQPFENIIKIQRDVGQGALYSHGAFVLARPNNAIKISYYAWRIKTSKLKPSHFNNSISHFHNGKKPNKTLK